MTKPTYNLLDAPWIPVVCRSGEQRWIAPHEVLDPEDPPVAVASPRADFDAALMQFLIGLVQTQSAPGSARAWREWLHKPPAPEQIREAFEPLRGCFFLDGDGPRFMQDLELTTGSDSVKIFEVRQLLIEDGNADLFSNTVGVAALGFPGAAAALFTLQTNAPSGGRGHRTSLRGGGPLTTLLKGDTLWESIWLNILQEQQFLQGPGNSELEELGATFPWMQPTRTSRDGTETHPGDVHPAQHFWGMPRRIRLQWSELPGRCSLLSREGPVTATYLTLDGGTNYAGAFKHPLTPYRPDPKGEAPPNSRKGRPEGIPYRDWPDLVFPREDREPARVVAAYASQQRFESAPRARLWSFGFDTDNMKARGWHESVSPLFPVPDDLLEEMGDRVSALVEASEHVRKTLVKQIGNALEPSGKGRSQLEGAASSFWSKSEAKFFRSVADLRGALVENQPTEAICERWLSEVHAVALAVFEEHSQLRAPILGADIKRVAKAWSQLRSYTSPRSKKLRKIVGLL